MKSSLLLLLLGIFFIGAIPKENLRERYSLYAYIKGNTLQLLLEYSYNNPNLTDDEFGTTTEISLLKRNELTIGDIYKFPSSLIKGEYQRWGAEDPIRIQPMAGSLGIVSMTKETIEVYIKTDKSEAHLNGVYTFPLGVVEPK